MTVQAIMNLQTARKRKAEKSHPRNFKFQAISRSSAKFLVMTFGALKFRVSREFNDAGLAEMISRSVKSRPGFPSASRSWHRNTPL